jgi:hypothetical protein
MFRLEALNAEQGDCLLLHYGNDSSSGLLLVDGGPSGVYKHVLCKRLEQLRADLDDGAPLPIDLLVVSHIDDDHIHGIVDLSNALVRDKDDGRSLPFAVGELWHNSFEHAMKGVAPQVARHLDDGVAPAQAIALAAQRQLSISGNAVEMASVGQGATLRDNAKRLEWDVNRRFAGGLAMEPNIPAQQDIAGLALTVVGPRAAELELLREEWERTLESSRSKAIDPASVELSAFVEKTATNLSSIAMLAEYDGKTALFTGDARGDNVLSGLRDVGLLSGPSLHVDVLKLPHHGSKNNVAPEFFEQITADHYVISANGDNDNPDVATLLMLLDSRADDDFTLHITNDIPHVREVLQQARGRGRQFRENVRRNNDLSIVVSLA